MVIKKNNVAAPIIKNENPNINSADILIFWDILSISFIQKVFFFLFWQIVTCRLFEVVRLIEMSFLYIYAIDVYKMKWKNVHCILFFIC